MVVGRLIPAGTGLSYHQDQMQSKEAELQSELQAMVNEANVSTTSAADSEQALMDQLSQIADEPAIGSEDAE